MELKVWADGVVRVVCGLSLNTSCQDVVIALAQAMGQTGRYILMMKLRGSERRLGANDCPLQSLAQLGQQAAEAQFVLRRTGPSLSDGPNGYKSERLPPPPGHTDPAPLRPREPQKALSFSSGHSTVPRRTKSTRAWSPSPRASPDPFPDRFQPATGPLPHTKEEVFRQILKQEDRLRELESRLQALEGDLEVTEGEVSPAPVSAGTRGLAGELSILERTLRQNEALLVRGEYWESQLQEELNRERDTHERLEQMHSSLGDYDHQLQELHARCAQLGQDVRSESHRRGSRPVTPRPEEKALGLLNGELDVRLQQAAGLGTSLLEKEEELQAAQNRLEERLRLIEELNKELRQCNLQQFIRQAGVPPVPPPHKGQTLPGAARYLCSAGILEPEDLPDLPDAVR